MSSERYRNVQQQGIEKKTRQRAAKHVGKVVEYRVRTNPKTEHQKQREEEARRERERRRETAKLEREMRREAARKEKELEKANEQKRETLKMSGHERRMRGDESERRVLEYLKDEETFPWILAVLKAKVSQPGYDCTLTIDKKHPLSQHIQVDIIYVDAKSSIGGVDDYFSEQARKCHGERTKIICNLNRFALSAGPEQELEELDLQMVLQILLLCGALFDEEKTTIILELLDERLVDAYRSEEELINKYVYAYIRTNLVPENAQSSDAIHQ